MFLEPEKRVVLDDWDNILGAVPYNKVQPLVGNGMCVLVFTPILTVGLLNIDWEALSAAFYVSKRVKQTSPLILRFLAFFDLDTLLHLFPDTVSRIYIYIYI